jgi:hypothetical protein
VLRDRFKLRNSNQIKRRDLKIHARLFVTLRASTSKKIQSDFRVLSHAVFEKSSFYLVPGCLFALQLTTRVRR